MYHSSTCLTISPVAAVQFNWSQPTRAFLSDSPLPSLFSALGWSVPPQCPHSADWCFTSSSQHLSCNPGQPMNTQPWVTSLSNEGRSITRCRSAADGISNQSRSFSLLWRSEMQHLAHWWSFCTAAEHIRSMLICWVGARNQWGNNLIAVLMLLQMRLELIRWLLTD